MVTRNTHSTGSDDDHPVVNKISVDAGGGGHGDRNKDLQGQDGALLLNLPAYQETLTVLNILRVLSHSLIYSPLYSLCKKTPRERTMYSPYTHWLYHAYYSGARQPGRANQDAEDHR